MLYNLIQIVAFQALFLIVYDLFLRRETFFNCNRAYLLMTSILSLVLPFLKFQSIRTLTTKNAVISLPEVFIGSATPSNLDIEMANHAGITIYEPETPIWLLIFYVGVVLAGLLFLFRLGKLYWIKSQSPKRWNGNILVVQIIKSSAAFSFFNTIFLGDQISDSERPTIYNHEVVHVKEFHTVDLVFFELLKIVLWFNPLAYIYQNRAKELHEFIADSKAIKHQDKIDYYQSLLRQVFDVHHMSFTNSFFKKSLIKKRITMLQKSKSKQKNLLKYTLILPLVFGMLIYSSTEVRAQETINTESSSETQELTDEELLEIYYNEILKKNEEGVDFMILSNFAGISNKSIERYIETRESFLKLKAFTKFIMERTLERKREQAVLTDEDIERTEQIIKGKHKSYVDYLEWKKTDEAKAHWESITSDGVHRLFVNDMANKTPEEQMEFDQMLKGLDSDDFHKVVITDGKSIAVFESVENDVTDEIEIPFHAIDNVPSLAECQDSSSNEERKQCFNDFINDHVKQHFNSKVAKGLNEGRKRVFVQFKIATDGHIKDIIARGPSKDIEEEAKRVIKLLPRLIPGTLKGKSVTVPYSLPISFEVE